MQPSTNRPTNLKKILMELHRNSNAVKIIEKGTSISVIQPLTEKGGTELKKDSNVVHIIVPTSLVGLGIITSEIVGDNKETVIGFTDEGLLLLTIALNEYQKNRYPEKWK